MTKKIRTELYLDGRRIPRKSINCPAINKEIDFLKSIVVGMGSFCYEGSFDRHLSNGQEMKVVVRKRRPKNNGIF